MLLLPGQRSVLEGFRQKFLPAVRVLHQHLQSAQVTLVEPETGLTGSFFLGELNGSIDILATRADGQSTVLDLKWSSAKTFRQKLQENKHLQLAIYGESIRQKTGKWAVPAYFILTDCKLYAQDKMFFPEATVAQPKQDGGSAILWQQAQETLRWRYSQIQSGDIELVFTDTEADENSSAPLDALAVEDPSKWPSDYGKLVGWRADA